MSAPEPSPTRLAPGSGLIGVWDLLDNAARVYRQAWRPLVLAGALFGLPGFFAALRTGPDVTTASMTITGAGTVPTFNPDWLEATLENDSFGMFVLAFVAPLVVAATIRIAASYDAGGQPGGMGEQPGGAGAWRVARSRYWQLLGTSLLFFLLTGLALPVLALAGLVVFALITVPAGLVLIATAAVFAAAEIAAGRVSGGFPALRRGFGLMRGRGWAVLGRSAALFTVTGITWGLIRLLAIPVSVTGTVMYGGPDPASVGLVGWLATAVTAPYALVGLGLLYVDIRQTMPSGGLTPAAAPPPPTPNAS